MKQMLFKNFVTCFFLILFYFSRSSPACQILTTVRKPVSESNNVHEKLSKELVQPAQSLKDAGRILQIGQVHSTSIFNHLDVQSKGMILEDNFQEERQLIEPAKDNSKADSCELSAGNHIQCGYSRKSLDSSASEDFSNSGITSGMSTNYGEKTTLHNSHYSVHILSGYGSLLHFYLIRLDKFSMQ